MFLNENLFEEVKTGDIRGHYKKKYEHRLTYNKFCDTIEHDLKLNNGEKIKYRLDANTDPIYNMQVQYTVDENVTKKDDDSERIAEISDETLVKPLTDYLDSINFEYKIKQSRKGAYRVEISLPDDLLENKTINHRGKLIIEKKESTPKEFTLENQIKQLKHTLDTAKSQLDSIEKNKDSYMLDETNPRYEEMLDKYNKLVDSYKETIKVGEEKLAELSPKNESLKENLTQTEQKEYGLNTLVNDLIKSELDAVNDYNSAIVTFETEGKSEFTDVIRDIINEEHTHIGQLQAILAVLQPSAEVKIDDGIKEGDGQIEQVIDSTEGETEEETTTTIDTEEGVIKTYKLDKVEDMKESLDNHWYGLVNHSDMTDITFALISKDKEELKKHWEDLILITEGNPDGDTDEKFTQEIILPKIEELDKIGVHFVNTENAFPLPNGKVFSVENEKYFIGEEPVEIIRKNSSRF